MCIIFKFLLYILNVHKIRDIFIDDPLRPEVCEYLIWYVFVIFCTTCQDFVLLYTAWDVIYCNMVDVGQLDVTDV